MILQVQFQENTLVVEQFEIKNCCLACLLMEGCQSRVGPSGIYPHKGALLS